MRNAECAFVWHYVPTASEDALEKRKQEDVIMAENIITRGKSERVRKLASTQLGDYEENSTARRIILNNPPEEPNPNSPTNTIPKPNSPKIILKPKKAPEPKKALGGKATGGKGPLGYNPFDAPLEERK
ncbi:unnamed protein product [Microthlaspi erraticum]|uniref:Uncharacterized protein n=1 Tax=Microthlaspi erraticum TaxID=1685480 RepID=A0A6D2JMC1_9BRAS|nr:unnamed protein product [Microthlaspi erraticum]